MLYTLSKAPSQVDIGTLLSMINNNDILVLFQDGVVLAIKDSKYLSQLMQKNYKIYAIKSDLLARGLDNLIEQNIQSIDYLQFVELTELHNQQVAW